MAVILFLERAEYKSDRSVIKRLIPAIPLLAVLVAAQQAGGPQRNVGRAGTAPKKSTSSAGTVRPAVVIGNSIVQVIDSLVAAGATKTKQEFETTDQFEGRERVLATRYGQLSFLLPERSRFDVDTGKMTGSFTYDADAEKMRCFISPDDRYLDGLRENPDSIRPPTIVLKSVLTKHGSYVGRNALGVTRVVDTSTTFEHGIVLYFSSTINGSVQRGVVDPSGEYCFSFPLDVSQARTIKPFLRLLVVGNLVEARVYKGSQTNGAGTLSAPYKDEFKGLFVPFFIDAIRVVDMRSGKVVATPSPE